MKPRKAQTIDLRSFMETHTYSLEEGNVVALRAECTTEGINLTVRYRDGGVHLITHRGDYTIWWAE